MPAVKKRSSGHRDIQTDIGQSISNGRSRTIPKQVEGLRDSRQQLRALAAYLQSARENERSLIAREIHDELGSMLTGLKIDLSWLAGRLPVDQMPLLEKSRAMSKLVSSIIQSVRRISTDLRPAMLDDLGLVAAIEWQTQEFQRRTGICTRFTSTLLRNGKLDRELDTAVFRILQETLTNVARHANATRVNITLKEKTGGIILTVRDNGKGITQRQIFHRTSLGILGMRERALLLGGEIIIVGLPGKGTTVAVDIPIKRPSGAARWGNGRRKSALVIRAIR